MANEHEPVGDAAVARAQTLADEVLAPAAERVDQSDRVPPGHLRALAGAGLFGVAGPRSHGGLDLDPRASRRVLAAVGGGCGATFFVWAQHHSVVRTVVASPNEAWRERLTELCAGRFLAGVAFAHLRRPGPPAVRATRIHGGWRLDGRAPWMTSWGMADGFAVAGLTGAGEIVWSMLPADAPAGLGAVPLALPVLGATGTVAVELDGCHVDDADVVLVEDLDAWQATDRARAAIGQPAVLGLAERAIRLVAGAGRSGSDPAAAAAERLGAELSDGWAADDAHVADLVAGRLDIAGASDHRAACLHLARRATTALLAAVGGAGMELAHPAQRLAREAAFYVVQAQTADGRAAVLRSV